MSKAAGDLIILHDRRDRPEANRLVRKFESAGYRVARQDSAGLRRGKQDKPTVVLWSRHAGNLGSALANDSAVIARLDGRVAPKSAQVTDLRGWRGQDRHQGWKNLLEAVGPSAAAPVKTMAPAQPVAALKTAAASAKVLVPSAVQAEAANDAAEPKSKGMSGVVIAIIVLGVMAAIAGAAAVFVL